MAYISVHVDMDEFSESELIKELESRGYSCVKTGSPEFLDPEQIIDFDRIEHLAICGQKDAARTELLAAVGSAIGCNLM